METTDLVIDPEELALAEQEAAEGEAEEKVTKKRRTPKEPKEPKEPKAPRVQSPYAGLSPHQRNRQLALRKYGTREDYQGNDFIIKIDPEVRKEIHAVLMTGKVRPSASKSSVGSDRYLMVLARMGWPEGVVRIIYPDEIVAGKVERLEDAEAKAIELREKKAQKAAEKAAAKAEAASNTPGSGAPKPRKSRKAKEAEEDGAIAPDGTPLGVDVSEFMG